MAADACLVREWSDDHFDVLADGVVVGHIMCISRNSI
jgi:hypothetical protein